MNHRADPKRGFFIAAMLTPFVGIFALFIVYPLIRSLVLAAHQTYGPGTRTYVGARNIELLANDPVFWTSVGNTLVYALGSLLLQLPLAFALALALNSPRLRGRSIYRLVFFSPQLMGLVFVSILGALAFEKRAGLVNQALAWITGNNAMLGIDWLQQHVMWTLILISLWLYAGFNMVYFLAALQNVDRSLIEASQIDGAGPVACLRHVILPSIRPVATFVVILSMIGSLQLFELPYILLDGSGGPNNRGLTVVMYLYQSGFELGDLGYASAIGWALAIMLIVLAVIQIRVIRREEAHA